VSVRAEPTPTSVINTRRARVRSITTLFLAACSVLSAAGPVAAQPPPPPPPRILIQGCALPTQPGCLTITSNGKDYNVTSATPPIRPGNVVTLGGTISGQPSTCPGINLTDINYTPTNAFCQ
jgi:multidrug efflux pump subunit AcrA (membrane-fusion protein)